MDNESYNIRVPKRWARIALIVGVVALIVAPLTAVATHTFNDVPGSHTFHSDIEWLEASGVTKGCNPPANTSFCPDDNVTRGQMSAFMKRFAEYIGAEDGTPAQADHATTADDADNAQTIQARSLGCSDDRTEFAGECWETNARSTIDSVFSASDSCGDDAGRLPYAMELRRFGQISDIEPPANEITATVFRDSNQGGATFRVYHIDGTGLEDNSTLSSGTYRCVFPLIETGATPASASTQGEVAEDGS